MLSERLTLNFTFALEGEFIRFIAGSTVGTGVWSKGTDYDAVRDTTDTDKMNFINPSNNNLEGMLYESSAKAARS